MAGAPPVPQDVYSLARRIGSIESRISLHSLAPLCTRQNRAVEVQSAALVAGWNTVATAQVDWPRGYRSAYVTVSADLTLVEGAGTSGVYGGAVKITTNGTDSHEQLCFPAYDSRTADDLTVSTVSDALSLDTAADHVTAEAKFYPWHHSWYPGDPGSRVAVHLLVVFIR